MVKRVSRELAITSPVEHVVYECGLDELDEVLYELWHGAAVQNYRILSVSSVPNAFEGYITTSARLEVKNWTPIKREASV